MPLQKAGDFYVYEWYIVETGEIIYVGKGSGRRYLNYRNNELFNQIRKNHKCDVRILDFYDDEREAFAIERTRTILLKEKGQCVCNKIVGGTGGKASAWTEERKKQMSENNPMKADDQRERMSRNNPMKNPEIALRMGTKEKKPIIIGEVEYPGIVDASRELNVGGTTIGYWLQTGKDNKGNLCYYVGQEPAIVECKTPKYYRKIWIDDRMFGTVSSAAAFYGWSTSGLIAAIKQNRNYHGHKCRYDNQQPSQDESSSA